ncbi:hypothetical protein P171DRAFT_473112 [Karstenula rhodostoma CBS 690.94]|uniref:F-box domain-containing protein n=1 Tax=Karstenula rhodostoma CBS 690.94 TaxID=1392251 RepID=A0A9P4UB77_9PLEO|nr:hypothetical protein P171DRAFT_473112 [Karstenula rhodostoma CBS 690.94]
MANLLTLPREVRDAILELVIFTGTPAPKTMSDLEALKHQTEDFGHCSLEDPVDIPQNAATLLLVNNQIHHEVKELIHLRGGLTYELNVKFVYESLLVPTWTYVPLDMDIVPRLRVTVQSLGKYRQERSFHGKPLRDPRTRVYPRIPLYVQSFYHLLRDILYLDPKVRLGIDGAEERALAYRVLEIDFIDPADKELLAPESDNPENYMCLQVQEDNLDQLPPPAIEVGIVRPDWLASSLTEHLRKLLVQGFYIATVGQMAYDVPFYSRIGQIDIKANGKVVGNLDNGQILADAKYLGSYSTRPLENWLDRWILWKETAMQRRRDRGFKVAEFPSDWKEKYRPPYGEGDIDIVKI